MVRALQAAGLSVWLDNHIHIGSEWENVLKAELERARCVVMLWSEHATESDWVCREGRAGLDRAVLIPVQIRAADIPDEFRSIQFADLTSWDGDATSPALKELADSIRNRMLPHCRIRFESLFQPQLDDLKHLYEAYFDAASRLGSVLPAGQFKPPSTPNERRRFYRLVSSLQVSIEWDPTLSSWFENSPEREGIVDRIGRIERHVPFIWLRMMNYGGPFFSSVSVPRAHANFLGFASLMFFHEMFHALRSVGQQLEIPSPLTPEKLSFPRWEGAIHVFFDSFEVSDEIARTYVTHIDDTRLREEEVFYGPQARSQRAYGKSLHKDLFTEPVWLERYLIPQRELRLALECSTEHIEYGGNVRVRKVTDLEGDDLPPLYEL